MSIKDHKIMESDYIGKDVAGLPDNPSESGIGAPTLKERFDSLTKNVTAPKHNALIETLAGTGGAGEIGTTEHEDINGKSVQECIDQIADKRVTFKTLSAKYVRVNEDKVLETSSDGESWQATGSSGHVIYDKNENEMPQRARMRFTDSEITDDGTSTIIRGIKGDQGVQGVQGPQGPQGVQGPQGTKGDKGDTGATGSQGLKGDKGDAGIQGPMGPQGPRGLTGADGRSFKVIALYATLYDLQIAHPTGAEGDAYGVGSAANNTIYIWDADKTMWTDIGALQGPQGLKGDKGDAGPQGLKGDKGDAGVQGQPGVKGDKGDPGIQGVQGPQGAKGDTGAQGVKGDKGDTGAQGIAGVGVVRGGATGQALTKVSGLDYDTQWKAVALSVNSQTPDVNGDVSITEVENAQKFGGQSPEYYMPIRIENENGTAIKFPDGTMICTKQITKTIDITRAWGTLFVESTGNGIAIGSFAATFVGNPTINVALTNNNANSVGISMNSNTVITPWRATSTPGLAVTAHVIAIGRWK